MFSNQSPWGGGGVGDGGGRDPSPGGASNALGPASHCEGLLRGGKGGGWRLVSRNAVGRGHTSRYDIYDYKTIKASEIFLLKVGNVVLSC